MIVPIALAIAYASGLDIRRIGLLAGAIYLPVVVGCIIVWVAWRARPREDNRPALFCEGVAAELRAGATLRDALTTAATSVGGVSPVGDSLQSSIAGVADRVSNEFPDIGEELRLTILNAARSGSNASDLFDEIGSLALAQAEIRHEVQVATAPGRATALLLVGAPTLYLGTRAGGGGLGRMIESSQQRVVLLVGLGLFLVGALATMAIIWRASR